MASVLPGAKLQQKPPHLARVFLTRSGNFSGLLNRSRIDTLLLHAALRTGRRRSSVRECRTQTLCDVINQSAHDHAGGGHRRVSPPGGRETNSNASQDVTRTGSWLMQVTIFRRRHQKRLPTQFSTSTHGPFELESMPPARPSMSQAATRAARCVRSYAATEVREATRRPTQIRTVW